MSRPFTTELSDSVEFVLGDATDTKLPDAEFDFVWGEDAWCYVEDKAQLIGEATRIVRPRGKIAFTDWVAGPEQMSDDEAERYLRFMKFPNVLPIEDYRTLLEEHGCQVETAKDTGRFPSHVDLYLDMLNKQLTYDALKLIGFDMELMQSLGGEMVFVQQLAHAQKISQARFVASKARAARTRKQLAASITASPPLRRAILPASGKPVRQVACSGYVPAGAGKRCARRAAWRSGAMRTTFHASPSRSKPLMIRAEGSSSHHLRP